MIRGFEPPRPLEPAAEHRIQWTAAFSAGLIAGIVLLLVPRGNPWSSLTFFVPIVMGRVVSSVTDLAWPATALIHLALSLVYGAIISCAVVWATRWRATLMGGAIGLLLYLLNVAVVSVWVPALRGNEASALFAHVVFGLIAGSAYRGLLRRRPGVT